MYPFLYYISKFIDGYKKWFESMSERVSNLNYVNPTESGRNITSIIDALKHIKSYDKISSSLQVSCFYWLKLRNICVVY